MFISVVISIFAFIFAAIADAPEFLIPPFFLFVIGAAMLVYKLLFGEKTAAKSEPDFYKTRNLNRAESPNELPPMQSIPVGTYEKPRRNTDEMKQPPSVTENTTRLLDNE